MNKSIANSKIKLSFDDLLTYLKIPDKCLVGKRIYKKLFYDNATLSYADKKALQENLDHIIWSYVLKTEDTGISEYKDDEREYLEISVLTVYLKDERKTTRLVNLIHRAIPYPLLLIFNLQDRVFFSIASKRMSKSEKEATVVEEYFESQFFNLNDISDDDLEFFKSLSLDRKRYFNFLELYRDWEAAFVAQGCFKHSGKLNIQYDNLNERKELLTLCQNLKNEIDTQSLLLKKEKQMDKKIELNTKIYELKRKYRACVKKL